MENTEHANNPRHYLLLTVAIFIGLVGVYFRFFGETVMYSIVSNIILVIAVIFGLKVVFTILE